MSHLVSSRKLQVKHDASEKLQLNNCEGFSVSSKELRICHDIKLDPTLRA